MNCLTDMRMKRVDLMFRLHNRKWIRFADKVRHMRCPQTYKDAKKVADKMKSLAARDKRCISIYQHIGDYLSSENIAGMFPHELWEAYRKQVIYMSNRVDSLCYHKAGMYMSMLLCRLKQLENEEVRCDTIERY